MSIYKYLVKDFEGNEFTLDRYKGKVMLIVNTASKCGFTPQFEDLQKLYSKYKDKGLEILGFPCNQFKEQEPGSAKDAKAFCETYFGATFPIFEKIEVNGRDAHPLYDFLKSEAPFKGLDMSNSTNKIIDTILKDQFPSFIIGNEIRWNFTKFLVDRQGNVVERFESSVAPIDIEPAIEKLI